MSRIVSQPIVWGGNVDAGYTGFISRRKDFVSAGIDWFERWDKLPGDPPVSHTFIITGPDSTIEAFSDGVKEGTLSNYLRDPNVALFAKRPKGYNNVMAVDICTAARRMLGERYNYGMIAAMAVSNTFLGHWVNKLTGNWLENTLTHWADRNQCAICSHVVATAMLPSVGCVGALQQPIYAVTPQELFSDQIIYQGDPIELLPPT